MTQELIVPVTQTASPHVDTMTRNAIRSEIDALKDEIDSMRFAILALCMRHPDNEVAIYDKDLHAARNHKTHIRYDAAQRCTWIKAVGD